MADRIVVLNNGDIEQIGTPDDIYNKPASTFVASFMGAPPMNMLPGTVSGNGTLELDGLGAVSTMKGVNHIGAVSVGVRPEKIKLSNGSNQASDTSLSFAHDFTEELGAARLVHGRWGMRLSSLICLKTCVCPTAIYTSRSSRRCCTYSTLKPACG